ncbi:MAG: CBS domain-containing protein [Candidatus Aenigmarchaeota archaeon]|nr:CBS domain-containing protein [Candidatus Aenigmarchaeota archaeon]
MVVDIKSLIIKTSTVTKETEIKDFIALMEKHKTDLMPVVDNNLIIGVVSENDLIRLIRSQPMAGMQAVVITDIPKNISKRTIGEIMTHHPITINQKATTIEAVKTMAASNLKRIIVVDDNKKLIGILRIKDLISNL